MDRVFDDERGPELSASTLRSAGVLDLDQYVVPEAEHPDALRMDLLTESHAGGERLPVSIEECRAQTLENNFDVKVVLLDPDIAATIVDEEEARFESIFIADVGGSDADPGVASVFRDQFVRPFSASAGISVPLRTGGTIDIKAPFVRSEDFGGSADLYSSDLDFSISHPLFRGAGRRANSHRIRVAALDSQIVQLRTKLEIIRQIAAADRAYWLLYEAITRLEIREDQYRQAMEHLESVEARVDRRLSPEIERTRALAGVSRRLASIIISRLLVQDRQRTLKRIMNIEGVDVDAELWIEPTSEPDPVKYQLATGQLLEAALEERVELLEIELALAQDLSTIHFERNQKLPLFILDYTYRLRGTNGSFGGALQNAVGADEWGWHVGLGVEVPIGNAAAEARVHRALLSRLQRLATRSAREQQIKLEVMGAIDNLEATWQRIFATRESVVLETRNYRGEQGQYQLGLRSSTEVLEAENLLAESRLAELEAVIDYQIAQTDLAFATGTLLGATRVTW